jgi:P-type conjugative transfer protein TrbJ
MNRFLATALAAASALAIVVPAKAQLAVFDPTNYAQNLLQAARALEQVQNQITSLQNEAQNLLPLGLKAAGSLNGDLAKVNGLLTEAGRLASEVQALRQQFDQQYASAPDSSGRALASAADARWRNSVESLRRTLAVQASVAGGIAATNAQATQLAQWSQESVGALQAAQAGNQLLAVQSKQLADLTALLAAQGQAEALEQARGVAAAADAKARLQRFLGRAP